MEAKVASRRRRVYELLAVADRTSDQEVKISKMHQVIVLYHLSSLHGNDLADEERHHDALRLLIQILPGEEWERSYLENLVAIHEFRAREQLAR